LSEAFERRDWRIYYDYASGLINEVLQLYVKEPSFSINIDKLVYAFDSTTIDFCLSLFPWANFRQNKAAIKLYAQLDMRGSIPTFVHNTYGKLHDFNPFDLLQLEPGAIYILDSGYTNLKILNRINEATSYFVIRARDNFNSKRISSTKQYKSTGVSADQQLSMRGFYSSGLSRQSSQNPIQG
jgi:hypothetical protein